MTKRILTTALSLLLLTASAAASADETLRYVVDSVPQTTTGNYLVLMTSSESVPYQDNNPILRFYKCETPDPHFEMDASGNYPVTNCAGIGDTDTGYRASAIGKHVEEMQTHENERTYWRNGGFALGFTLGFVGGLMTIGFDIPQTATLLEAGLSVTSSFVSAASIGAVTGILTGAASEAIAQVPNGERWAKEKATAGKMSEVLRLENNEMATGSVVRPMASTISKVLIGVAPGQL